MKKFLMMVFVAGLFACDNSGGVKLELDSTVKKIENSKTLDSIESKGGRILDSVKSKGGELWDSTKSKGGKLINKAGQKINERKDSTK
jgi:hypothetical protein